MSDTDSTLRQELERLDIGAAIERSLWEAYFDGAAL